MRLVLLITFGFCLLARGNPVPRPVLTNAYIASEQLIVTISPTEARFVGTFTFKVPGEFPKWKKRPPAAGITVPVWFPLTNQDNPNIEVFWRLLTHGRALPPPHYLIGYGRRPGLDDLYNDEIGLKAEIGKIAVRTTSFSTTPPEMDTPDREIYGFHWWRSVQEPDFHILRFFIPLFPQVFTKGDPVRICYRQPLLNADGNRRFFYAPVLQNLPAGVVSTDTNVYAITLETTPECELAVSYGDQHFTVSRGHRLTLAPKHFQPIRALVTPCSNPQSGADGRQPSSSGTNQTSWAAASRRSL